MQVPLLDLRAQMETIRGEVDRQISEVLDSCVFINGPKVSELEKTVAEYVGADHALGVSSGTDALLVALMALDVGPGDLVITTPYSFFATAGAVARLGATPIFVDIEPASFNLCPELLAEWFATHADKIDNVKAIIPVHLYGQSADMAAIMRVANEHGVSVIEDAAQAIGSKTVYGDQVRMAGSIGAMGCYSFFPSKNLGGTGDGGMVVTSDPVLAEKLRKLKNHGSHPKYYHDMIGGNFRLDALQAATLLAKVGHLEAWHQARRDNAAYYLEALARVSAVTCPTMVESIDHHIFNQFVLRVPQRDVLREALKESGIATEIYYPVPFHLQNCFAYLGYGAGDFPQSEAAAASTVAIPIYPELTREMQDHVVATIEAFYG